MKSLLRACVLCAAVIGLLAGCGGKSNQDNPFSKLQDAAKGLEQTAKDMEQTAKEMEEMENKEPVPPVPYTTLLEFLPKEVAGLKAEEPTGETGQMGEWNYSTVAARFNGEDGLTSVNVTINDFAYISAMYMPYQMLFNMKIRKESTQGYERAVAIEGFPAFETWKKKSEVGDISVIVGKRFIIKVETRGLPESTAKDILKSMNIKKLAVTTA